MYFAGIYCYIVIEYHINNNDQYNCIYAFRVLSYFAAVYCTGLTISTHFFWCLKEFKFKISRGFKFRLCNIVCYIIIYYVNASLTIFQNIFIW